MVMRVAIWKVTLLCAAAGCSGQSAAVGLDAAPDHGLDDAPPVLDSGGLSVSPTSLEFGNVDIGYTSLPKSVTVTNQGPAIAIAPTVTGEAFQLARDACPAILATGRSCEIEVEFAPVTSGSIAGVLTVAPEVTVVLRGNALSCEGAILASDRIDLGTVPVNTSAPVVVHLAGGLTGPICGVFPVICVPTGQDLTFDEANTTCSTLGLSQLPCSYAFVFKSATPGTKNEAVVCSFGTASLNTITTVTAKVVELSAGVDGGGTSDGGFAPIDSHGSDDGSGESAEIPDTTSDLKSVPDSATDGGRASAVDSGFADACQAVANSTFLSTEPHECGLTPTGPATCQWRISFADNGASRQLSWALSDYMLTLVYQCSGYSLTAQSSSGTGPIYRGTYDPATGILTWDGFDYTKVIR
jgi:hypothetical protein